MVILLMILTAAQMYDMIEFVVTHAWEVPVGLYAKRVAVSVSLGLFCCVAGPFSIAGSNPAVE
mgnify:CR=1 FL=1